MVLDTLGDTPTMWDETLKPVGDGTFEREPFEKWRKRHERLLAHLHPMITEQWIYRHWTRSPYRHLPINKLSWQRVQWTTARILSEVFVRDDFGKLKPTFDYEVFHGKDFEPGLTMDRTGTWNYPIVVLETPDGVATYRGTLPSVRYCLIEGHQRFRFLNALSSRGECAAEHSVFLLFLADTVLPERD